MWWQCRFVELQKHSVMQVGGWRGKLLQISWLDLFAWIRFLIRRNAKVGESLAMARQK